MKKIFRMALVFALAGATLMYTGCTKDYDEDINAANQKIESIVAQHAADVAALKNDLSTAVSNLEAAYKKADDAVTAAYKAADADLQKAIDANKTAIDANKAAIDANKAAIADANTAIAAIEEELKTFATKEELAAAEAGLEAKIKAVADDLADVKAKLDKVAEDLGKQISDLDAKFTTALAEQKADLEGQIAKALEAAKTDLGSAKAELEAALALLGNELRSIVFEPELYYAGIEATNYTWTWINPLDMFKAAGDVEFAGEDNETVTFKKDAEIYAVPAAKALPFSLSQLATANYSLNPSSFDVTKAEWALAGKDYEYLVRADEKKVWAPEFVKWDNGAVRYTIANPELLPTTIYAQQGPAIKFYEDTKDELEATLAENAIVPQIPWIILDDIINWLFENKSQAEINAKFQQNFENIVKDIDALKADMTLAQSDIETLKANVSSLYWTMAGQQMQIANLYYLSSINYKGTGYVPAMQLSATLAEGKNVVSDYAAIVSDPEYFAALAFNSKSEYKANAFCKAGSHLYFSAPEAIQNAASVPVAYDKNLDLNFVNIHMFDGYKGEYETTLAKLQEVYPDLELKYSLVDYYDGDNKTEESKYGKIVDGVFYPQCVDAEGNQVDPKDAVNGGISAVGRKPVVLVKLFNDDKLVLAGFFKIVIVKEIGTDFIDLPSFDTIPFICGYQSLYTTWAQFSSLVVEYLGTTYKQFVRDYELVFAVSDGASAPVPQGNWAIAEVYEKVDGKFVSTYDTKADDYKYGYIWYNSDAAGDGVNNVFEVEINDTQAKNIGLGKSKTLYVKFNKDLYEEVYVSFTVSVAEAASFDFGANKLANEWFKEIEADKLNTVKVNVVVPTVENDYIGNYNYSRNLDHYFVEYKPSTVLSEDADPIYSTLAEDGKTPKYKNDLITKYEYFFNATQTCGIAKFVVSKDGKALYAEKELPENLVATIGGEEGRELIYAETEVAKKLLNKFSPKETEVEKMLWADIHVKVSYGWCNIPAGDADFHARFLRPLHFEFAGQDIKEESQVNGANLYIKDFLKSIVDWNNQDVVIKDKNGKLVENVIKNKVNMYTYYGFQDMEINLGEATRNNVYVDDPKFYNMQKVTPEAKLTFGTADKDDYFTPITSYPYGWFSFRINSLSWLDGFVINYRNDSATIDEFTIKIPVKINYYWGTIADEIEVNVKKTEETQPGK